MDITRKHFGMYNNHMVTKITLENDNGVEISCITLGATWTDFKVPRLDGTKANLLLNFDTPAQYEQMLVGQTVGRVGGRIAHARFHLNNQEYHLEANDGVNLLHGGAHGFQHLNWNYTTSRTANSISAIFQRQITQELDGFPGDILVTIIYTLNNNDQVTIAYSAQGDSEVDTLFNPTSRAFFNLSDHDNLASSELMINTPERLRLNEELIPTGDTIQVAGTPYDFQELSNIGQALLATDGTGIDMAYVVNGPGKATQPIAVLRDADTGRQVTIDSDRNGLMVYTMNHIASDQIRYSRDEGKRAHVFEGIALEAQTLPDAINQTNFGDIVLPRGGKKTYRTTYTYRLKD